MANDTIIVDFGSNGVTDELISRNIGCGLTFLSSFVFFGFVFYKTCCYGRCSKKKPSEKDIELDSQEIIGIEGETVQGEKSYKGDVRRRANRFIVLFHITVFFHTLVHLMVNWYKYYKSVKAICILQGILYIITFWLGMWMNVVIIGWVLIELLNFSLCKRKILSERQKTCLEILINVFVIVFGVAMGLIPFAFDQIGPDGVDIGVLCFIQNFDWVWAYWIGSIVTVVLLMSLMYIATFVVFIFSYRGKLGLILTDSRKLEFLPKLLLYPLLMGFLLSFYLADQITNHRSSTVYHYSTMMYIDLFLETGIGFFFVVLFFTSDLLGRLLYACFRRCSTWIECLFCCRFLKRILVKNLGIKEINHGVYGDDNYIFPVYFESMDYDKEGVTFSND